MPQITRAPCIICRRINLPRNAYKRGAEVVEAHAMRALEICSFQMF